MSPHFNFSCTSDIHNIMRCNITRMNEMLKFILINTDIIIVMKYSNITIGFMFMANVNDWFLCKIINPFCHSTVHNVKMLKITSKLTVLQLCKGNHV